MRGVVFVLALTALSGCQETQHCEGQNFFHGGQCIPLGDATVGPDTGIDASLDASSDTGIDAGHDGGNDGGPCAACGLGQVCSEHADGGTDAGAVQCVACVVDSDCTPIDGGQFDSASSLDAGPIPGATICENFQCVFGCRSDSDCRSLICRADHRCSAYPPASSSGGDTGCLPCDSERNCAATEDCVETFYPDTAHSDGPHCVPLRAASCLRPYVAAIMRQNVDGDPAQAYCFPNEALASCAAIRSTLHSVPCTTPNDCAPHGAADGAMCQTVGSATACTYPCGLDGQCPMGLVCNPTAYCH